jgi:hypothetical protein
VRPRVTVELVVPQEPVAWVVMAELREGLSIK